MEPVRSSTRRSFRPVPLGAHRLMLLASLVGGAAPVAAQQTALQAACGEESTEAFACRRPPRWASPRQPPGMPASPTHAPIDPIALAPVRADRDDARLAEGLRAGLGRGIAADPSGSDAWVILGAALGAAIVGIPAALIGHEIDRGLHEDEPSEDPGEVGAYSGLFLGAGVGGVVGAHIGSGGRGSPWVPLGIVGAGIPLMMLSLELGALSSTAGVVVAVAIELEAGGAQ